MELSQLKAKASEVADEAALESRIKTATARAKAQGRDFFADIVSALRDASIPQSEIDTLTSALATSTDRNRTLARLLTTTHRLASALRPLLK